CARPQSAFWKLQRGRAISAFSRKLIMPADGLQTPAPVFILTWFSLGTEFGHWGACHRPTPGPKVPRARQPNDASSESGGQATRSHRQRGAQKRRSAPFAMTARGGHGTASAKKPGLSSYALRSDLTICHGLKEVRTK